MSAETSLTQRWSKVGRAAVVAVEAMENRCLLDAVPGADIRLSDVVAGGTELSVTVLYTADAKVSVQSVDKADLVISRASDPQTSLQGLTVAVSEQADTSPLLATYIFAAPGGTWDSADNGDWTVAVGQGQVLDAAGNAITGAAATLNVNIPLPPPPPPPVEVPPPPPVSDPVKTDDDDEDDKTPVDKDAPEASIKKIDDIRSAGGTSISVEVEYEDDVALASQTVGTKDLKIVGPDGKSLNVTTVGSEVQKGGRKIVATYTANAPGGEWDYQDNGEWTVTVLGGGVRDETGKGVGEESESFKVKIDAPPPPPPPPVVAEPEPEPKPEPKPEPEPEPKPEPVKNVGPTVTLTPLANISAGGTEPYAITVTFKDADGIDASTIGKGDLDVTGPNGPVTVESVSVSGPADALTATYMLSAPGASWDAADNGKYAVVVKGDAVADNLGKRSDEKTTAFDVNIAPPAVVIDDQFSNGTPVSSGFVAESATTLEDGRILLAGRQGNLADGSSVGILKRLNADGSVDRTFGNNGVVKATGGNIAFYGMTVLADGSVLATGQSDGDVIVQRYKSNGSLDKQFGNSGSAIVDWGAGDDTAYGIATTPDGRIVVGGGSDGSFGFSRLTADGAIDTFFGTLGSSLFALGGGQNVIGAIAVQLDGRIVGVGSAAGQVAVLKLLPNGEADNGFGTGGAIIVNGLSTRDDLGDIDYTLGLALQDDGRILVANRSNSDFAVTRLLSNGGLDASFGSGGRTTIDFGGDDDADAVVVQNTGDILVVGTTDLQGGRIAVAALHANGSINSQFGDNGRLTLESGLSDSGRALHVGNLVLRAFASARGNQVVVGGSQGGANAVSSSGLRRLNVPGAGLLGRFGAVDGKNKKLRFIDGDGTTVTLNLKGGSGQAYYDGSNVDLVLTGVSEKSKLKINAVGGDGRIKLRNVKTDGAMKNVVAKTADLSGTFFVGGSVSKLALGNVGGTLAADGSIGVLSILGDADRATVLAGANFGSDQALGGTGAAADSYTSATIRKIDVKGAAIGSLFAAGLNRGNSVFLDSDDAVEGGDASRIEIIKVKKGIDETTRFVAGYVGKVKTTDPIDMADDERIVVL